MVPFEFRSTSQSITSSITDINKNLKFKSPFYANNIATNVGINNLRYRFYIHILPFDLLIDALIIENCIISFYVDKLDTTYTRIFKMRNILILRLTNTINVVIQDNTDKSSNYVPVNSYKLYVLNDISIFVLEDKITNMCAGFEYSINELIDCHKKIVYVKLKFHQVQQF